MHKLITLISLAFVVFVPSAAHAQSITVVGDDNYPPYLFKDSSGNTTGYVVDIWKLWEQKTGVQVNLVSTNWANAQQEILGGKADVIEMMFRTSEREPYYSFTEPFETVQVSIYTTNELTGVTSIDALQGFVIGVQNGDACVSRLNAIGIKNLRTYENYRQIISDMLAKKIKIACIDEYPANYYLYLLDAENTINKAFTFYSDTFYRAVRKGDLDTLALVEQGMRAISKSELNTLAVKWKGSPVQTFSYKKSIFYGVAIISIFLALLALWVILLKLAVKNKMIESQKKSRQIEIEHTKLREIIEATRAGTWEWNVLTGECVFSTRWAEMLGYTLEEVQPSSVATWRMLTHPDDVVFAMQALELHFAGKTKYYECDMRMRHKNGDWIWVSDRGKLVSRTSDGRPLIMRGTHIDITERKLASDAIWKQANYDALTQLPNRLLFNTRLDEALKHAQDTKTKVALVIIDLDNFKEVNDTLGHPVGDDLIIQAGNRIVNCLTANITVARVGGDEFCILITDADDVDLIETAQNVLESLAKPYSLDDQQIYVSASLGICIYPNDAANSIEIMRNADQALHFAKSEGRNRFSLFKQSMRDSAIYRMQLAHDLRQAIQNNELIDYYQPIIEISTGKIFKAEALLRWTHPVRGHVSPTEFILIAEDMGIINEIGNWIFTKAAQNAKEWSKIAGPKFAISVNKSPLQFKESEKNLNWIKYLQSINLSANHIIVEITEGLLLRKEKVIEDELLSLRDAGVQVALDDFGTGYSSLSYLTKFDIDFIKIDQSFTRNLVRDNETQSLCEAIIVMSHKLGLKVIAEGVETKDQLDILQGIACDFAQGYYFSKPVPAEEFQKIMYANLKATIN